ncbi:MAG: zinc-ribbon domain containing protein [Negativicutes bacterium]
MYTDKELTCRDCGVQFAFTAREQDFYAEKGFQNEPTRCPDCRRARKQQNNGGAGAGQRREMFNVTCSECGCDTQVPFRPSNDKPVYCRDCFQAKR